MIGFRQLGHAGRLGNQLWQIASTAGVAIRNGQIPVFPLDWAYRPYVCMAEDHFVGSSLLSDSTDVLTLPDVAHIDERVRVYLQDYHLFEAMETTVRSWFRPSSEAMDEISSAETWQAFTELQRPVLSVHVRRGDYVTNPIGSLTTLSNRYYQDAIEAHANMYSSICVFADDPDWCEKNFNGIDLPNVDLVFRGTEYDYVDLFVQTMCDEHVIANSTYSWWGAFLSQNTMPIYPSRWCGEESSHYIDTSLMFPDSWVKFDAA